MSSACQNWLSVCLESLKAGLANALKYATNLKSLVIIRDSVVDFEAKLTSPSENVSWPSKCESLFKQRVDIWSQLVAPFYYSQSKVKEKNKKAIISKTLFVISANGKLCKSSKNCFK